MAGLFWPKPELRDAQAEEAESLFDEMVLGFEERHRPRPAPEPARIAFSIDRSGLMPWASEPAAPPSQQPAPARPRASGFFDREALMPWLEKPQPPAAPQAIDAGTRVPGSVPSSPESPAAGPAATAQRQPVPVGSGEIETYIRQAAARRGIDPDIAVRVALSEGGLDDPVRQSDVVTNGVREQSFGPFQLYLGGGLGNAALAAGIDPRNPAQWRQAVDFALDNAARGGWGPWHGAARVGIGNFEGIGTWKGPAGAPSARVDPSGNQLPNAPIRPLAPGDVRTYPSPSGPPAATQVPPPPPASSAGASPPPVPGQLRIRRIAPSPGGGQIGYETNVSAADWERRSPEERARWEIVQPAPQAQMSELDAARAASAGGGEPVMARLALGQPQPMPEDASESERFAERLAAPTTPRPQPVRNDMVYDPLTQDTLYPQQPTTSEAGVLYRGPLSQRPAEIEPSAEYDPRDADQGPWESGYTAPGSQPSGGVPTVNGPATPLSPAAPAPYDPRDYDQGPRESGPLPWTPLSPNPELVTPAQPASIAPPEPGMAPPGSPYAPGQAESMTPAPARFAPGPTVTGQAVEAAGQYVAPVFEPERQAVAAFTAAQQPGGILEPAGGGPRILERMEQIEIQAAQETGHDLSTPQGFLTRRRAVRDERWRAANPALAAEYDQLEQQLGLTVAGQVGDAARIRRPGETVPPFRLGGLPEAFQPHVVPPDVVDTLDFPIRVPDDPATIRAIEAAGGRVDPERGVDLYVTRAQSPSGAGATATRGGVFYEAVPPGGSSQYVGVDDPTRAGGSQVIPPTPTRFRSPLILSDAPGEMRGFNEAAEKLGIRGPASAEDIQQAEADLARARDLVQRFPWTFSQSLIDERMAALEALRGGTPIVSADIDSAIRIARRAGPAGSPQRAQALKDLVTRYGGDPDLIDDLLLIRGADASESAWAIKENILTANARKQGYDGVVTMREKTPRSADLETHPLVKAATDAAAMARAEVFDAQRAAGKHLDRGGKISDPEWAEITARIKRAEAAYEPHQRAIDEAEAQAWKELSRREITELVDVREARNPTPPSPTAALKEAYRRVKDAEEYLENARAAGDRDAIGDARRQLAEAEADLDDLMNRADDGAPRPGYELRSDVPRRPETRTSTIAENEAYARASAEMDAAADRWFAAQRALTTATAAHELRPTRANWQAYQAAERAASETRAAWEQARAAFEDAERQGRYVTAPVSVPTRSITLNAGFGAVPESRALARAEPTSVTPPLRGAVPGDDVLARPNYDDPMVALADDIKWHRTTIGQLRNALDGGPDPVYTPDYARQWLPVYERELADMEARYARIVEGAGALPVEPISARSSVPPTAGALGAVNRAASEAIAGGTAGAVVEQARNPDEDPRTAAGRGFLVGAAGFPAATRLARGAARLAGAAPDAGGGARATFGALPPNDPLNVVSKRVAKLVKADQTEADRLVGEFKRLMDSGAPPSEFAAYWRGVEERNKIKPGEVLALYRRFNMLSGPRTFEVNALSGALNLGYEVLGQGVQRVATGRLSDAAAEVAAPFRAAGRAFGNLVETLWHGVTTEQAMRGDIPETLSSRTDNPIARGALTVAEIPDRVNAAVDQFFRTLTEEWAATTIARNLARSDGVKPGSPKWAETVAAKMDEIRADPTKYPRLKQLADRVTFSEEPGGLVKWLEEGKRKYPNIIGFIAPFVRTPANIASRAVDLSPMGVVRNLAEGGLNIGRGRQNLTPRIRDNVVGIAATYWAYTQAQQGNITGAGPDDPEKIAMLRVTGWQPYSVKIGDRYWSYANFAPFSLALSTGAAIHEAQQYAKEGKTDTLSMLADGSKRTAKVVTDMTVLAGLGAVVKSIQDPDRYGTQWLTQSLQQLMPAGSFVNTIGQATDPTIRRSERTDVGTQISQNIQARVPGLRENVPIAQDPLGRPIPNEQTGFGALNPFRPTTERPDPTLQAFLDAKVDIGKPREKLTINGTAVPLTGEEQRRWNELRGQEIQKRMKTIVANGLLERMKPEQRQERLEGIRDDAAARADDLLWRSIPFDERNRRRTEARKKAS